MYFLSWQAWALVKCRLSTRRDLGAGFLPARLGPAAAAPVLSSPLALAWRLHRGSLIAWDAGAALFGFLLGVVGINILVVFLALELGWELQQISQAVFNLSPFAYVHWSIQVAAASLIGLTLVTAMLTGSGLLGSRKRDIA